MNMHVAFLRGMNLGRRRIRNEQLCLCFEALGFEQVSALLASGNVIFSCGAGPKSGLERLIESGLEQSLGYSVPTFVRSAEEVAKIAEKNPFSSTDSSQSGGKLQVALLSGRPSPSAREKVLAHATAEDQLAIHATELYWLPKGNLSDSELDWKSLSSMLGSMTTRTHRTLTRLVTRLNHFDKAVRI